MDKKNEKDCCDWRPLNDGTMTGDPKYCNLSLLCKQLGMKSDWYKFRNENGEEAFDYFCTGMYMTEEDKGIDEEVS
jgi:hypothetical protein